VCGGCACWNKQVRGGNVGGGYACWNMELGELVAEALMPRM